MSDTFYTNRGDGFHFWNNQDWLQPLVFRVNSDDTVTAALPRFVGAKQEHMGVIHKDFANWTEAIRYVRDVYGVWLPDAVEIKE